MLSSTHKRVGELAESCSMLQQYRHIRIIKINTTQEYIPKHIVVVAGERAMSYLS